MHAGQSSRGFPRGAASRSVSPSGRAASYAGRSALLQRLQQDGQGGMQEDGSEQRAGQQIGPARPRQPDKTAGGGHAETVNEIVAGAEPDGADIRVAFAIADQQQGGHEVGGEAKQAETGDDVSLGRLARDGSPDGVAEDGDSHENQAQALEHRRPGPHPDRPADHPQTDGVGRAVSQKVHSVGGQGRGTLNDTAGDDGGEADQVDGDDSDQNATIGRGGPVEFDHLTATAGRGRRAGNRGVVCAHARLLHPLATRGSSAYFIVMPTVSSPTRSIGRLSAATGVKVPTIRFYEQIGLLPPAARNKSDYRVYDEPAFRRLSFIRHARQLGFEIDDIRALLDLTDEPERPCGDVNRIAERQLAAVDAKIAGLQALRTELSRMQVVCAGGRMSDCRVIEALSGASEPSAETSMNRSAGSQAQ